MPIQSHQLGSCLQDIKPKLQGWQSRLSMNWPLPSQSHHSTYIMCTLYSSHSLGFFFLNAFFFEHSFHFVQNTSPFYTTIYHHSKSPFILLGLVPISCVVILQRRPLSHILSQVFHGFGFLRHNRYAFIKLCYIQL